MLKKGDKVKIRFRRLFENQMFHFIVGEVIEFNNDWLKVYGRNYYSTQTQLPPKITPYKQVTMVPRENIRNVDILRRDLDLDSIKYTYEEDGEDVTSPEDQALYREM